MANYVSFYKENIMKIYAILFDMVRKNVGIEDLIKSKGLHCADFITNSWTATTLSSMFSGMSPSELYPMKVMKILKDTKVDTKSKLRTKE